jgi:hypothetical protein
MVCVCVCVCSEVKCGGLQKWYNPQEQLFMWNNHAIYYYAFSVCTLLISEVSCLNIVVFLIFIYTLCDVLHLYDEFRFMDTFFSERISVCECGCFLVHVWGVTADHDNNFWVKTNTKQEIKHTQEILTSGNAFAPFYITKMISLHGT